MKKTNWFKHEIRMAEIAEKESCCSSMIWHIARAGMLINVMTPIDFIEIPEDVWNAYERIDMIVADALEREEAIMTIADEVTE